MTQTVKTFRTERGARNFIKRLRARWPHKLFQTACMVGLDFRDSWYVEVMIERGEDALWVGVGPMTTKPKT